MQMLDLLVIGAGLTGLFAAYTAARSGLRVKVIAMGTGATHWHAGTIDVLGYTPHEEEAVADWVQALPALPTSHPYRLLGVEAIGQALQEFKQLVAAAGLPYAQAGANNDLPASERTNGKNYLLISPVGAPRPAFLAPAAQQAGNLADSRPMVIVGLAGTPDFYPALIAENLQKQGHNARFVTVSLHALSQRRDKSHLQLARMLDQPDAQARWAEMIVDGTDAGERVGFPAVAGLKNHADLLARLRRAGSGRSIFEIPTLPPSVPGMRLDAALRSRLVGLGVRVEMGMEVCEVRTAGRRIRAVATETGSRPLSHSAKNFLLATGGILGGGIRGDRGGRVLETVFDLPLAAPHTRARWLRPRFLDQRGHPIFQGGVPVDDRFQPLDEAGVPVYQNLWAAGSILAHTDPIRERSSGGIALATGYAAARQIVNSG